MNVPPSAKVKSVIVPNIEEAPAVKGSQRRFSILYSLGRSLECLVSKCLSEQMQSGSYLRLKVRQLGPFCMEQDLQRIFRQLDLAFLGILRLANVLPSRSMLPEEVAS